MVEVLVLNKMDKMAGTIEENMTLKQKISQLHREPLRMEEEANLKLDKDSTNNSNIIQKDNLEMQQYQLELARLISFKRV